MWPANRFIDTMRAHNPFRIGLLFPTEGRTQNRSSAHMGLINRFAGHIFWDDEVKPLLTTDAWHLFSENSRKLWLFLWPFQGFPRIKPRESLTDSQNALNSRISGTRKGKPAANLGSTLSWTLCPQVFYSKPTAVTAFASFSDS